MNSKIIISNSYREIEENAIKICANIYSDKPEYKLWFEIEKKYEAFISDEKQDAFVVAILPYAVKKELDIVVEGKISEKLCYQLNTYLLPVICKNFEKRIIKVEAQIDNKQYNIKNAVGTGISCGIDSFYTISNHCNREEKDYNITHLTFFNAGASGEYGGDKARELYRKRMKFARKFAEENNFEFVCVDSNMNEFLMMNHEKTHTYRSLSCVLILQKLFSKYYYSSAYEYKNCGINQDSNSTCAHYDPLNLPCLSTEDTIFYSSGTETNRLGKVKKVTEFEQSYKYLNVCVRKDYNCGECEKCKRTMLELDSLGKLDLYKSVFNVEKFKNEMNNNFLLLLQKRKIKNVDYIDMYNKYKEKGVKIPINVKLKSLVPNKEYCKYIACKFVPKTKIKKFLKIENNPNRKHDGWMD